MDLGSIQESLNDAVAESTLEADATLQSRDAVQTVASDCRRETQTRGRIFQITLLGTSTATATEVESLRKGPKKALGSFFGVSFFGVPNDAIFKEVVRDVNEKEARWQRRKLNSSTAQRSSRPR